MELARFQVGLQSGSGLLQTGDCQALGDSQIRLVVALMDDAMGLPGARRSPLVVDSTGSKASTFSDKAEGSQGG